MGVHEFSDAQSVVELNGGSWSRDVKWFLERKAEKNLFSISIMALFDNKVFLFFGSDLDYWIECPRYSLKQQELASLSSFFGIETFKFRC